MYKLQEKYNKVINRLIKKEVSDSEFNSMNKGLQAFYHKIDELKIESEQVNEEPVEILPHIYQKINKKK